MSAAAERGFGVVALPGASAVTAALAASGVPTDFGFVHLGFLPRRRPDRLRVLRDAAAERRTLTAFETPHRLARALRDVRDALGDRRIAVCRELTKMHEEVFRGSVSDAIAHFTEPRGEFTLVIAGAPEPPPQSSEGDSEKDALQALARLKREGASAKDAASAVSESTGTAAPSAVRALAFHRRGGARTVKILLPLMGCSRPWERGRPARNAALARGDTLILAFSHEGRRDPLTAICT